MTNYEWLLKSNEELVKNILAPHVSKEKGIPNRCSKTNCDNCDFNRGCLYGISCCADATKKWLEEEHEPLYKKGDIVIDSTDKIILVTENYYGGEFISVSRYFLDLKYTQYKIPITDIKKKVGYIEESEVEK